MERWSCLSELALRPRVESQYVGRKPLWEGFWPKMSLGCSQKIGKLSSCNWLLERDNPVCCEQMMEKLVRMSRTWEGQISVGAWNWISRSGRRLPGAWILQGRVYSRCQHSQCSQGAGVALEGTRGWTQSSSCYSSLVSPDSCGLCIACRKTLANFSFSFWIFTGKRRKLPEVLRLWCWQKQTQMRVVAGWRCTTALCW